MYRWTCQVRCHLAEQLVKEAFRRYQVSLVGREQADSGSFGTLLCAFYLRKIRSVSWPLFSFSLPSIFESLWDVWASPSYFRCGWRPWAEKLFPGSFERIPTASTAPWTPLHVRSTAPWTRTRTSEKATFLLPVCTRNTYSALVGLFSIKTGCCLKKRAGHGRWRERNERKQLDLHVHTRGESKDSSTTWLWQSVSAVPQHCLTTPLSHLVANVKRRQLLWKTRENRHKWFCPTRASPSSRSWCHTGNRLGANRNPPFPTRNARCHDQSSSGVPVEVKAVRNVVSGDRHKLPKPIRKTRLPEVRKCMCFQNSLSTRGTFFAILSKRNDFQNFCNQHSVLTLHMFFSSFAEWCERTKNI